MKKIIAQFIPIVIIFILLSYFKGVVKFSHTILGKLLAICIIVFYTILDKIVGALVCAFVILYYQSDTVENMLNMDLEDVPENNDAHTEPYEMVDDTIYLTTEEKEEKKKLKEGMVNYVELYGNDYNKDILIKNETLQDEFRNNNCVKGELMNKDVKVNYEMTEHVFPEIKFRRGFCNPCLKDCEFSIIEKKLATEDKLIRK